MKLLTLPLSVRRQLLEYEEDKLTPQVNERAKKYERCPRCGGACHQHLSAERPFSNTSTLPRTTARCVDCGHEIDTQTGLTVKLGNVGKVEEPFPTIKPTDD